MGQNPLHFGLDPDHGASQLILFHFGSHCDVGHLALTEVCALRVPFRFGLFSVLCRYNPIAQQTCNKEEIPSCSGDNITKY